MPVLMYLTGALALAFGAFAASTIASDIQVGLAATGFIGGFALLGLGRVLQLLEKPERKLEAQTLSVDGRV